MDSDSGIHLYNNTDFFTDLKSEKQIGIIIANATSLRSESIGNITLKTKTSTNNDINFVKCFSCSRIINKSDASW